MEKEARKASSDSFQEKLRVNKANWNKDISAFIDDLISVKRLINGWPSKFYKERSKIIEPIPADPGTIIGSLTNDFNELSHRANAIIEEQSNYSKNRKQKQIKPTNPSQTPANLSQQFAWENKYSLISEGSNPFTRFLARNTTNIVGTGDKAKNNRIRIDMLNSCAKVYKSLGKMQVQAVKSTKDSINETYRLMKIIWHEWTVVARGFTAFEKLLENKIELSKNDLSSIKNIIEDFNKVKNDNVFEPNSLDNLKTLIDQLPSDNSLERKEDLLKNITIEYENILSSLNKQYNLNGKTLDQINSLIKEQNGNLQSVAQAFIKKWLGKTRHQIFPQNFSSYRLEIFDLSDKLRTDLNQVMNLLEKDFDPNVLNPLIYQINQQMSSIKMLVRSLYFADKPEE